jgi:hypothetical protein
MFLGRLNEAPRGPYRGRQAGAGRQAQALGGVGAPLETVQFEKKIERLNRPYSGCL